MEPAKSSIYMATVAPGLESVAESEILAKLNGAWLYRTFRGKVLFGSAASGVELLRLRCADNLYAHAAWLTVGPSKADLRQLADIVAALDLDPALAHLDLPKRPTIRVSASRYGKHAFSRFEAGEAMQAALVERRRFRAGDMERHDVGLRLDIMDDDALLSVKLTPPGFRFRGAARQFAEAALRPTVAHALVWLSGPRPNDVFLDPFCGSGAIAIERSAYPARRIAASDLSPDAVLRARRNVAPEGEAAVAIELNECDAHDLPFEQGTVTSIVTNPPWGNQIGVETDVPDLYRSFLNEARRVLTPGGKVLLLTNQTKALEGACRALGLPCERLHTVSLHGLTPIVYRIG